MLCEANVTVTVGVPFDGGGGVVELPPPHPAMKKPVATLRQITDCRTPFLILGRLHPSATRLNSSSI
jgi:hypothetical protein